MPEVLTPIVPPMLAMKIVCHGGACCGIKTIKGFHYGPKDEAVQPSLSATDKLNDRSMSGTTHTVGKNWFTDDAPAETTYDRLVRYVNFIRQHRPGHYVEVVLTAGQLKKWEASLKKVGFRELTDFVNSNSETKLHLWYLVIKKGKVLQQDP